jgi:hypothetical protein
MKASFFMRRSSLRKLRLSRSEPCGRAHSCGDGNHSPAKALHGFENLETLAAPNSIIAIHDVVPMTWMPKRQRRRLRQRSISATWRNLGHDKRARLRDLRNFKAQRDDVLDSDFLRFYGTAECSKATDHPFDMCR